MGFFIDQCSPIKVCTRQSIQLAKQQVKNEFIIYA